MSTVNSDKLPLSHTAFRLLYSRSDFGCSQCLHWSAFRATNKVQEHSHCWGPSNVMHVMLEKLHFSLFRDRRGLF